MKKLIKHYAKSSAILLSALAITTTLLAGCKRENPILNDESIQEIRDVMFFYPKEGYFVRDCHSYLGEQKQPDFKVKAYCDKSVQIIFAHLMDRDAFQHLTDQDRLDPQLWHRVFSPYLLDKD